MNADNARDILRNMRVPDYLYAIGTDNDTDERMCLSHDVETGMWMVWYSERGYKTGLREFSSEAEACKYFIETLSWDAQR